jgi:hypothetical protein
MFAVGSDHITKVKPNKSGVFVAASAAVIFIAKGEVRRSRDYARALFRHIPQARKKARRGMTA